VQKITFNKKIKEKIKKVYYIDSDNQDLYGNKHFIIRLKKKTSNPINYDLEFKVRNEHKELVKGYDLFKVNKQQDFKIEEQKFEEDIVIPFSSKFSISTELEYDNNPILKTWNDVLAIFPNLKLDVSKDTPLSKVNDNILKIKETTFKLGELLFEGVKKAEVEFSLWCNLENECIPVISEFDIDVNAKDFEPNGQKERDIFDNPVIVEIDNLYKNLQNNFTVDKNNTTKTEFFYNYKKEN